MGKTNREKILEELEQETKQGDAFFNLFSNSFDVYLAVAFTISFTFFIQSYFLKNKDNIINSGLVNDFIIWGLMASLFILFIIVFQLQHWKKKSKESKKRQIKLMKQYVK